MALVELPLLMALVELPLSMALVMLPLLMEMPLACRFLLMLLGLCQCLWADVDASGLMMPLWADGDASEVRWGCSA
jgi:hypothetical protein